MARPSPMRSRAYSTSKPCGRRRRWEAAEIRQVFEELEQLERRGAASGVQPVKEHSHGTT